MSWENIWSKEQRLLFWEILSNSFNLCYQIHSLEAHEYKKVNQAFLLSAAKLFSKPYLDLFAFFPPFKSSCVLHDTSPLKDCLPEVLEVADPVIPAKSNSQQSYFWHSSQKSHITFMLNSLQQLETVFFFLLSVHLEGNVEWNCQDCSKLCYFPGLPANWPWGLQKQKGKMALTDLVCELPDSGRQIIFVVLLKISTIAE